MSVKAGLRIEEIFAFMTTSAFLVRENETPQIRFPQTAVSSDQRLRYAGLTAEIRLQPTSVRWLLFEKSLRRRQGYTRVKTDSGRRYDLESMAG